MRITSTQARVLTLARAEERKGAEYWCPIDVGATMATIDALQDKDLI